MIELGEKVKSIVSGFTGIVTARCEYLNGCIQYCVQPPIGKDGKPQEALYIDQDTLKVIDKGILKKKAKPRKTGGPQSNTPPSRYRGDGSNESAGVDGRY